jgi:hydrophobe/amphiphile efflux-3 (HAE3) family protein
VTARLTGWVLDRSRTVLAVAVAVTLGLGVAASRLEFRTSQDTLVDPSSQVFRDNVRYQESFGGEAMLVLFSGDVRRLFAPGNRERLDAIETELRRSGAFHAVIGPLTVLRYAEAQVDVAPGLIAAAADRGPDPAVVRAIAADAARLANVGERTLANPAFVEFLLFGPDGELRPSMRDVFPDRRHALMVVHLRGNASIDEQARAAELVREVVGRHRLPGFGTLATGSPVLLEEINDDLRGDMAVLGAGAVVVMLAILGAVFRVRWRLLPLAVVVVGTVWAFGVLGLAGIPLTMVTISGLPIFIGLGVDFAVQMQNRFEEELAGGDGPTVAVRRTMRYMAPPLVVSMVAAVAGVLALQLSAVPMIRDFGAMLAIGVVALVVVAVAVVPAVLRERERRRPTPHAPRGARGRAVERLVRLAVSAPAAAAVPLVVVALAVAGVGLAVEERIPIQTDPERWIDQSGDAVRGLEALRAVTGYSSDLGIMVEAPDVTGDEVVAWMHRFARAELARHPPLVRAASIASVANDVHGAVPVGSDAKALLAVAPPDIRSTLVSADHRRANLAFPIGPVSLGELERLLDELRADLAGQLAPPPGVRATPSGLAVIGIELVDGLEANRRAFSLAALGLVAAWLVLRYRSVKRAVVPLVPVVAALGLAMVVMYAAGVAVTPLTTVAGPLVIAVATEFSVLIEARYREEREAGRPAAAAVAAGLPRIGRAFVASGLTVVGGFGVLALSPMPLLREFGLIVAADVLCALASALVILPPLLVRADTRAWPRPVAPPVPAAGMPLTGGFGKGEP